MIPTSPADPAAVASSSSVRAAPPTLLSVLTALEHRHDLSPNRRRDLRSAVTRMVKLMDEAPSCIVLNLPAISAKLAAIHAAAVGLTPKTLSNIRSDFLAAVNASGLQLAKPTGRGTLSPRWAELLAKLPRPRHGIGLSRLARYASGERIEPHQIDDAAIESFISAVRQGSLHRKPNDLHRSVTKIWNEAARQQPELELAQVTVPSFRGAPKRIDWELLTPQFRRSVDKYLRWCGGSDVFAADGRPRTLAPLTLRLRRVQIHAAVTALITAGTKPSEIKSLAALVAPDAFTIILRQRYQAANGRENAFNRDLAEALIQIAREWVKVKAATLAELKRPLRKMPLPQAGLTGKNKRFLRQFDDPAVMRRFRELPEKLWTEIRREAHPNFRTLAKAQATLAIGMLSYMPIRLQNLTSLTFGVHLFLREEPRALSTLEIPAAEMKNKTELAFDIPPQIAKMLIEYRDRIAPKIVGHRPDQLFVNADGSPKSAATVAWLIASYVKRRAGVILTPHQFRHLSARVLLDAEPGSFETVRQLLGHKNLKTTANFYAGIDSRRAARHHQQLIEQALAERQPLRMAKRPRRPSKG
jgi:integrase